MFGTIIGDIIGSRFEFMPNESREFTLFHSGCNFTDDTICQTGLIDAMNDIDAKMSDDEIFDIFATRLAQRCNKFPAAGYGSMFVKWLDDEPENRRPYNSFGNGCIMRDAPCIWMAKTDEDAYRLANLSSLITHNHPDAVETTERHARLLRAAIHGASREETIREAQKMGVEIRPVDEFVGKKLKFWDAKRTFALAMSLIAANDNPEDVVRDIVLIGSDTDTTAAIALQFEEAFGNIPDEWMDSALRYFGFDRWDAVPIPTAKAMLHSPLFGEWSSRTGKSASTYEKVLQTVKHNPAAADDIFAAHGRLLEEQRKTYSSPVTRFLARLFFNDKTK